MKVGVLTLPLHTNYGGNLQAYALVTTLKNLGHDAWLIRWEKDRTPSWKAPLTIAKRLFLKYISGKTGIEVGSGIFDRRKRAAIEKHAKGFINRHISPQTKGFRSTRALARHVSRYHFDTIVVGSDQVWRPAPNVEDYFLGFLDKTGGTARRVAYAASFGTDQWTFSPSQHQVCARQLKKFDAVSVREDTGVILCRQHFGVQAEHVIDPTMLLQRNHYVDLAWDGYPSAARSGGKGLFVYVLDADPDKTSAVDYIANSLGLSSFAVDTSTKDNAVSLDKLAVPPVENWLRAFDEADFVVTDSFHGCAFSIIFNKPFIAYGNKSRGLSRFESLLRTFRLDDRLVSSSAALSSGILHHPIDWLSVNNLLDARRAEAITFLMDALATRVNHTQSNIDGRHHN